MRIGDDELVFGETVGRSEIEITLARKLRYRRDAVSPPVFGRLHGEDETDDTVIAFPREAGEIVFRQGYSHKWR